MKAYIFIPLVYILHTAIFPCCGNNYYSTYNWKFHFPQGSSTGLFFALAMPLDIPNKSVFISYYFEGVYALPGNQTEDSYPPLVERSETSRVLYENEEYKTIKAIDRKLIYNIIEAKLSTYGYPGHSCMLRTICEMELAPVKEVNGVLGELFHIIFMPSSSINEELSDDYRQAENNGKIKDNCTMYYKDCNISILNLMSYFKHAMAS